MSKPLSSRYGVSLRASKEMDAVLIYCAALKRMDHQAASKGTRGLPSYARAYAIPVRQHLLLSEI